MYDDFNDETLIRLKKKVALRQNIGFVVDTPARRLVREICNEFGCNCMDFLDNRKKMKSNICRKVFFFLVTEMLEWKAADVVSEFGFSLGLISGAKTEIRKKMDSDKRFKRRLYAFANRFEQTFGLSPEPFSDVEFKRFVKRSKRRLKRLAA